MINTLEDENLYNIEWIDIENTEMDYENYLNDIENFFREDFEEEEEEEVTPKYNTMKLQSMTGFVLQQKENCEFHIDDTIIDTGKLVQRFFKYANFLKQPLTLGMFVPCDEEGNVLEEPSGFKDYLGNEDSLLYAKDYEYIHEYAKAQEKVIFEGWELNSDEKEIVCNYNSYYLDFSDGDTIIFQEVRGDDYDYTECLETIEDLSLSQFDFKLTPSAIKSIGL